MGGRVLFDCPPGMDPTPVVEFLERQGHPVTVCHGPEWKELCPILKEGHCPRVEHTHGVIFELDLDRPQHRAILRTYTKTLPEDVPIRVILPHQASPEVEAFVAALPNVELWDHVPDAGELDAFAARVDAADQVLGEDDGG